MQIPYSTELIENNCFEIEPLTFESNIFHRDELFKNHEENRQQGEKINLNNHKQTDDKSSEQNIKELYKNINDRLKSTKNQKTIDQCLKKLDSCMQSLEELFNEFQ